MIRGKRPSQISRRQYSDRACGQRVDHHGLIPLLQSIELHNRQLPQEGSEHHDKKNPP